MAIVEKAKATAKVVLTGSGNHVNYFDTKESAETYAADANKRAENMGIKARYEAADAE